MAKVRKFDTGVERNNVTESTSARTANIVPDIPQEAADSITASAPVKIRSTRGNPRKRRYKQKTYSLLQEDIDVIEELVFEIRKSGLYERGRSDIVRAGVRLLESLPLAEKLKAVQAVESLK